MVVIVIYEAIFRISFWLPKVTSWPGKLSAFALPSESAFCCLNWICSVHRIIASFWSLLWTPEHLKLRITIAIVFETFSLTVHVLNSGFFIIEVFKSFCVTCLLIGDKFFETIGPFVGVNVLQSSGTILQSVLTKVLTLSWLALSSLDLKLISPRIQASGTCSVELKFSNWPEIAEKSKCLDGNSFQTTTVDNIWRGWMSFLVQMVVWNSCSSENESNDVCSFNSSSICFRVYSNHPHHIFIP